MQTEKCTVFRCRHDIKVYVTLDARISLAVDMPNFTRGRVSVVDTGPVPRHRLPFWAAFYTAYWAPVP